ncbi:MAG: hypothetical protein KDC35_12545 [Acidobacteria bacterium]|nr:hypothetical protein [Acidobacteriota bacterium]
MNASITKLTKNLRYASFRPLIGLTTTIESLRSMPHDVTPHLEKRIRSSLTFDGPTLPECEMTLIKYGILDLRFKIDQETLDRTDEVTIDTLSSLGFSREDLDDELRSLRSEIKKGKAYLRLFLRDASGSLPQTSFEIPETYFPHEFVIEDACLTNAPSVWVFKHFYL